MIIIIKRRRFATSFEWYTSATIITIFHVAKLALTSNEINDDNNDNNYNNMEYFYIYVNCTHLLYLPTIDSRHIYNICNTNNNKLRIQRSNSVQIIE